MLKNEKESKGSRIEYEWNDDRKIHQSLSHINLKLLIDWIYLFISTLFPYTTLFRSRKSVV